MSIDFSSPWRRFAAATALLSLVVFASAGAVSPPPAASSGSNADADVAAAKSLSAAFRSASQRVMPAVVAIENKPKLAQNDAPGALDLKDRFGGRNPFEGTPFGDLFKNLPEGSGSGRFHALPNSLARPNSGAMGIGSGVIIDDSGVILTNNHVVEGGGDVTVRLQDGREFKATSVVTDPKTDLAIVRIEGATGLTAATLADSDQVQVGDWVLALGQPFGLESTVTAGIVSATHRGIGIAQRESFIQTDAAINPGNSGGPLVNLDGQVVGINTAISSRSGSNSGVGFAVPAKLAQWVSQQLLSDGVVHRAYLGVGIQPVTQEIASQFGVQPRDGVVVTQVMPDTPAAKMGLRSGDVITKLDGVKVSSAQELQLLVEQTEIGKAHPMVIVRDGKSLTLAFSPETQPATFGAQSRDETGESVEQGETSSSLGMTLQDLTPAIAERLGVEETTGVIVTGVEGNSPAARAGLKPGMVIRQVNRQDVSDAAQAVDALQNTDKEKGVLLLVQTDAGSRFVVVEG